MIEAAWAFLLASTAVPGHTLALVTVSPSTPERLEQARARVPGGTRWLSEPRVNGALEGFERPLDATQRARDALARARERWRSLDVAAVRSALSEAQTAAEELTPTAENRLLAAEIAVQRAQLELLEGDRAKAQQMLGFALSATAGLSLDPARYPPTLIDALERARRAADAAPSTECRIDTTPAGAVVETDGSPAASTPLRVALKTGPRILWVHQDGLAPKAAWEVVGPDCSLAWTLGAVDEGQRLQPFVDAIRQNEGDRRRAAAEALAEVLGVDGVAVLPAVGIDPVVYLRVSSIGGPPSVERSSVAWYRDVWGDLLTGAGVLALGGAAVTFGVADRQAQLTQGPGGDYPSYLSHRQTAQSLRTTGGVMTAVGGVGVVAGIVRYAWLRPRAVPVSVALSPGDGASLVLVVSGAFGR